jgi:hypothetical protein
MDHKAGFVNTDIEKRDQALEGVTLEKKEVYKLIQASRNVLLLNIKDWLEETVHFNSLQKLYRKDAYEYFLESSTYLKELKEELEALGIELEKVITLNFFSSTVKNLIKEKELKAPNDISLTIKKTSGGLAIVGCSIACMFEKEKDFLNKKMKGLNRIS